jgi:predicted RNA-binding protein
VSCPERRDALRLAVVDGQGGGIGSQIISKLRNDVGEDVEILALGTNAIATATMMKAGANKGATGENAITVNCPKVEIVCGSSAIVVADSMMGEMTPASAAAIASCPAIKLLLPLSIPGIEQLGFKKEPLPHLVEALIARVRVLLEERKTMCEANAYLVKQGKEELLMEALDILRPEDEMLYLRNIYGEQKKIRGVIKEMNLVNHRVVIEEK